MALGYHFASPFCVEYFPNRFSRTICLGQFIGVSHLWLSLTTSSQYFTGGHNQKRKGTQIRQDEVKMFFHRCHDLGYKHYTGTTKMNLTKSQSMTPTYKTHCISLCLAWARPWKKKKVYLYILTHN
jgi:phosphosulfolactate synthase (CoM biosynthesis protein A)